MRRVSAKFTVAIAISVFCHASNIIYTNISLIAQTALAFLEIVAQLYECIKSCKCYMQTKLLDVLYDLIMHAMLSHKIKSDRYDKSDKERRISLFSYAIVGYGHARINHFAVQCGIKIKLTGAANILRHTNLNIRYYVLMHCFHARKKKQFER